MEGKKTGWDLLRQEYADAGIDEQDSEDSEEEEGHGMQAPRGACEAHHEDQAADGAGDEDQDETDADTDSSRRWCT